MSTSATRAAHSTRCVCHGNGYWFAGSRRTECGYRPCISCGNSAFDPENAGLPYRCEYCTPELKRGDIVVYLGDDAHRGSVGTVTEVGLTVLDEPAVEVV